MNEEDRDTRGGDRNAMQPAWQQRPERADQDVHVALSCKAKLRRLDPTTCRPSRSVLGNWSCSKGLDESLCGNAESNNA
jgi:hypothetical protein